VLDKEKFMSLYKGYLLLGIFAAIQGIMVAVGVGMFVGILTGFAFVIGYEAGKEDK
jgi:hypothetical protein